MQLIKPNWPAPANIHAYTTTRDQGYSQRAFANFNLAKNVGEDSATVEKNRDLLGSQLALPSSPVWLSQIHSTNVINIDQDLPEIIQADAAIATLPNRVCAIMTADCLPLLLCNQQGTKVAAVHAGWRGLANGIVENTVLELQEPGEQLMAWLGPAIGPLAFEVSADVLEAFVQNDSKAVSAFKARDDKPGKWLANLYDLARQRLQNMGLSHIYGGEYCTFSDEKKFYSYRRDQGITGRMATLIWLSA